MKLLFIINTPAQAHTWRYIISRLKAKGVEIDILARDYGSTQILLDSFGYKYDSFKTVGAGFWRFWGVFEHLRQCFVLARQHCPSLVIGFGVDAAITAALINKSSIVFIDDETSFFQNKITYLLTHAIISPDTFKTTIGKKHILINSLKELAYLHPAYYQPDPSVYSDLKLDKSEKYVVIRLNAFDAVHDIGAHGFATSDQLRLVHELSKYARVFISPESSLSDKLMPYLLQIPKNRMHDVLFYAQMLVTDTQTMATEASLLGTPVIRSNSFVGAKDMQVFVELERKYDLVYSIRNAGQAIQKAVELVQQPDLKDQWAQKRLKLLQNKIDLTSYMVNYIDKYSQTILRKHKSEVKM